MLKLLLATAALCITLDSANAQRNNHDGDYVFKRRSNPDYYYESESPRIPCYGCGGYRRQHNNTYEEHGRRYGPPTYQLDRNSGRWNRW